jgi:hypothetical protein
MDDTTSRVGLVAGPGLVGRFGETVLLVAGDGGAPAGDLLDLVEAAAAESVQPGTAIAVRLAGWIGTQPPGDVAFGLVAPVPDGVVVFLRGPVWAEVTGGDGTTRLSGTRALTWVDQVVPLPVERVTMCSGPEQPVPVHPRSALVAGVVPAQGFVLTPSGAPPAVVPAAARASATASSLPAPPPRTPAEAEHRVPERQRETVPPSAPDPAPQRDARETALAPAPLGALVCDDGPTVPLDRAYVLGREPHQDPDVQNATASPVVLRDPDQLISRVHARVSVDGGAVFVQDAPSVSGTFIAAPGAQDWMRVGTDPTQIFPGWSLRIGTRVFVFKGD